MIVINVPTLRVITNTQFGSARLKAIVDEIEGAATVLQRAWRKRKERAACTAQLAAMLAAKRARLAAKASAARLLTEAWRKRKERVACTAQLAAMLAAKRARLAAKASAARLLTEAWRKRKERVACTAQLAAMLAAKRERQAAKRAACSANSDEAWKVVLSSARRQRIAPTGVVNPSQPTPQPTPQPARRIRFSEVPGTPGCEGFVDSGPSTGSSMSSGSSMPRSKGSSMSSGSSMVSASSSVSSRSSSRSRTSSSSVVSSSSVRHTGGAGAMVRKKAVDMDWLTSKDDEICGIIALMEKNYSQKIQRSAFDSDRDFLAKVLVLVLMEMEMEPIAIQGIGTYNLALLVATKYYGKLTNTPERALFNTPLDAFRALQSVSPVAE